MFCLSGVAVPSADVQDGRHVRACFSDLAETGANVLKSHTKWLKGNPSTLNVPECICSKKKKKNAVRKMFGIGNTWLKSDQKSSFEIISASLRLHPAATPLQRSTHRYWEKVTLTLDLGRGEET